MTTVGTMIDRIRDEAECSTDLEPTILLHINDAIAHYRARRFWFNEQPTSSALTSTTTASNSYVSRYTGLIQLDSLRITVSGQKEELTQVGFEEMERLHDGSTSTGEPFLYCLYGDRIRLYPTPNDTYTLTWSGIFEDTTVLDDDADENAWTTEAEQLIRHRACKTFMRDVTKDMPEVVAGKELAEREALQMLERETIKRSATRRIKAGC